MPAPPSSSGKMVPIRPSSPSWRTTSVGNFCASSQSRTWGAISASANSRTMRRSCCCSGVWSNSMLCLLHYRKVRGGISRTLQLVAGSAGPRGVGEDLWSCPQEPKSRRSPPTPRGPALRVARVAGYWGGQLVVAVHAGFHGGGFFLGDDVAVGYGAVAGFAGELRLYVVLFVREPDVFGKLIDAHPG